MRKRLLLIGLLLFLAVPLALVLRSFARDVIVIPILYILWLGDLLFQHIPQTLVWALLLVTILVISARSLVKSPRSRGEVREVERDRPGQVSTWARWIHMMARRGFYKWFLAQHLARLYLATLAYHERLSREQIRQHLEAGNLGMPPEIQAYLQAGLSPLPPMPVGFFSRLMRRVRPSVHASPLDLELERVVQFLESQLDIEHRPEVRHDHRNHPGGRSN